MSELEEQIEVVRAQVDAWGWEGDKEQIPFHTFQTVQKLFTLVKMQSEEIERLRESQQTVAQALDDCLKRLGPESTRRELEAQSIEVERLRHRVGALEAARGRVIDVLSDFEGIPRVKHE